MGEEKQIERSTFMAKEACWFDENEHMLEKQYPGKWVALKGAGLIAIGDSASEVMASAKAQGIDEPLITALKSLEYQGKVIIRRGL